jgi:type IV pilus assembly protein PilA
VRGRAFLKFDKFYYLTASDHTPGLEKLHIVGKVIAVVLPGSDPMRSQFKTKWLQYLSSNKNQGFTLIELLVVIIIIGVLAAIALPTHLICANKVKQSESEARTYISSINRSQQLYFIEKHTFANSIEELGIGIKAQTAYYQYSIQTTPTAAFIYGKPTTNSIKSFVGTVFLVPVERDKTEAAKPQMETAAILCETNAVSTTRPANPIAQKRVQACATDTHDLTPRQ